MGKYQKQADKNDFKIWVTGFPTEDGEVDYCLVPRGLLEDEIVDPFGMWIAYGLEFNLI